MHVSGGRTRRGFPALNGRLVVKTLGNDRLEGGVSLKHAPAGRDIKNPKPELPDLGYNSYLWRIEIESVGWGTRIRT